jgi:hypothetical protein
MRSRPLRLAIALPLAGAVLALSACHGYEANPVVVGAIWDGTVGGKPNTAIPLTVLDQPSGLGTSRTNPGVLYVHSEKDHATMVAISAADARIRGRFTLAMPNVFDWEDMAVGPCPAGTCIYAGDIGAWRADAVKPDNVMAVFRAKEPNLGAGQTSGTLATDRLPFRYPDGTKKDAEALMVDPRSGLIYVITKTATGISEVFRFPKASPTPNVIVTLVKAGELTLPKIDDSVESVRITAATIHPTRNVFAVRTYRAVYELRGVEGGTLASAIAARPIALTDTAEPQGEALEYSLDGNAYFTLSEMTRSPYILKRVDRVEPAN